MKAKLFHSAVNKTREAMIVNSQFSTYLYYKKGIKIESAVFSFSASVTAGWRADLEKVAHIHTYIYTHTRSVFAYSTKTVRQYKLDIFHLHDEYRMTKSVMAAKDLPPL